MRVLNPARIIPARANYFTFELEHKGSFTFRLPPLADAMRLSLVVAEILALRDAAKAESTRDKLVVVSQANKLIAAVVGTVWYHPTIDLDLPSWAETSGPAWLTYGELAQEVLTEDVKLSTKDITNLFAFLLEPLSKAAGLSLAVDTEKKRTFSKRRKAP